MQQSRAPLIALGTFFVAQSWADSITDMPGFNLRQAQELKRGQQVELFLQLLLNVHGRACGCRGAPRIYPNGANTPIAMRRVIVDFIDHYVGNSAAPVALPYGLECASC
jgi:hypothetical protein